MQALFCVKERFPVNYWFMAVTTMMSGLFWGMTRAVVQTTMHFQQLVSDSEWAPKGLRIVAILFCSMLGATVASQVSRQRGMKLLVLMVVPGWGLGASCNARA